MTSKPLPFLQIPRIINLKPSRGPVSGGTIVNITGSHLDAGSNVSIMFKDQPCTYLRLVGWTSQSSSCKENLKSQLKTQLGKLQGVSWSDSSQIISRSFKPTWTETRTEHNERKNGGSQGIVHVLFFEYIKKIQFVLKQWWFCCWIWNELEMTFSYHMIYWKNISYHCNYHWSMHNSKFSR